MVYFRTPQRNGAGIVLALPTGFAPLLASPAAPDPAPAVDALAWAVAVWTVERRRAELVSELSLAARNLRAKAAAGFPTPTIDGPAYARLLDRAAAAIGGPGAAVSP